MIKIYYADIDALKEASVFEQLYEKVKGQRRSKILRCKNKEDKCRSLGAGLLLKVAMEQQGIDYENAVVSVDEQGKPYLEGDKAFPFSLSHSGELAVCGVWVPEEDGIGCGAREECMVDAEGTSVAEIIREKELQIGIDVEEAARIERICSSFSRRDNILDKIATSQEKEWFYSLPEDKQTEGFLRIWTGKESYGKRNGKGIIQDLREVNVLKEEDFLFVVITEVYYLTVCMENINKAERKLIPIDIAKEYLK